MRSHDRSNNSGRKFGTVGGSGLYGTVKSWVCGHPVAVLLALICATAVVVYYPYLFCREIFVYTDIGSDTQNVYYPFFSALYRKLADGDFSMMDFTHGLGTNILIRTSDTASIFTYLQFLLGEGGMKFALIYVHIFKIVLSGIICYYFLGCFKFSSFSKVLAAYVYAFNGFTVLWGQHYFFATASVYIILMLFAIEKSFADNKGYLLVAFSAFVVMLNSYYLAYMVLLVAAVYALFRLAVMYTRKQISMAVKRIGGLLGAVIVGAMMSACIFLPAVYVLLGTNDRVSGGMSLIEKVLFFSTEFSFDKDTLWGIVSRFFSNNLMGTVDYDGQLNYYEMPQWFFTSFTAFVAVLFVCEIILDKGEACKIKVLKLAAFALVIHLAFHPFLSLILNGFVTYFFRYTFVVMPLFALAFADVLEKIIHRRLKLGAVEVLVATVAACVIFVLTVIVSDSSSRIGNMLGYVHLLLIFVFGLLAVMLQMLCRGSKAGKWIVAGIAVVFVMNVTAESYVTTNARVPVSKVNENIYMTSGNDDVRDALNYIEKMDNSFHRTEKTFQDISYLNDAMLEGYYGVSVYNSTVNYDIVQFVAQMVPALKVHIADGYYDFREIAGDIDRASLLGVKYLLSMEYLSDIPEYSYVATFGSVHLYRNTQTDGIVQFFTSAMSPETFESLDEASKAGQIGSVLVLEGLNIDAPGKLGDTQSVCTFEKPSNSSYIHGTVSAKQDGWVFVSIPYEEGWTAYVDGEQADILKADYAFCAIAVEAGDHVVELRYRTPLLDEGIAVSCVGFCAFIAWGVFAKLKGRKKH